MTDAVVFRGGRVFTGRRYADALLIEAGRVVAVGTDAEVARQAPTGAERREIPGRLIVPGLVDAHLHLAEIVRQRHGPAIADAGSFRDVAGRVAAWAAVHPGGPVVGRGWDPERWSDRRWPDRRVLDASTGDRPTILYHASGHAALANTAALREAGIDPDRPAPDDPAFGRAADGRPDGLLFEDAMRAVGPVAEAAGAIDGPSLARVLSELVGRGITAVGTMATSAAELAALAELDADGRLPIEVRAYVRLGDAPRHRVSEGAPASRRLRVTGVKAFLDGAFGPRTAWLGAPYADAPSTSGLAIGSEEELGTVLGAAAERGLAPAVHAIGDRAVDRALRLLAPLVGRTPAPVRIEHVGLTPPELLPALARVRPALVVQPGFVASDGWLSERLGRERSGEAYRFRTFRSLGLVVAGSSDAPFDPVDPWRGIRAAVRRRGEDGRSANPDPAESLPVEEALGLYTTGAAEALGMADRGRLEPGAPADLVVLSVARLGSVLDAAPDGPSAETWVAGRPVDAGVRTGGP